MSSSLFCTDSMIIGLLNHIRSSFSTSCPLHRQVDNLLDMSRLESGNLKPAMEWNDVTEMLYNVAQQVHNPGVHTITVADNDSLPLFRLAVVAGVVWWPVTMRAWKFLPSLSRCTR